MKYPIFFILLFFGNVILAQENSFIWKINSDTIQLYKPYFNDEFQGTQLDKEKWLDIYQWGGLDFKTKMFSAPEMTYVSNGKLTLGADTTSEWYKFPDWILDTALIRKHNIEIKDNKMQLSYLTSVIFSKEKFRYGYFECKAKAPSGQGLWPAFWLFGGEPNEEIDFMEMKGEKHNEMHVDVHCPNKCKLLKVKGLPFITRRWGGWLKFNNKLVDEWVIYSGLWEPGKITFYVNGELVAEFSEGFKTSMHLITNLSIAVDGGPFKPGINKKTVFPNSFEVDYIRVWKNPTDSDFQKTNKKIDFGNDEPRVFNPIKETKLKTKKGHMLKKKSVKNEMGFVTIMPVEKNKIQISKNGRKLGEITMEFVSTDGTILISQKVQEQTSIMDLSGFKKGQYTIRIKHNNKTNSTSYRIN
jgi:beta-glucanase (GH16 family)